jgi:Cu/Ag efflux pump CusA
VRRVLKIVGDRVREHDVLAEIESAELGRAEAQVLAARAREMAAEAQMSPASYILRGEGLLRDERDIGDVVPRVEQGRAPVLVKHVADVNIGPALRYGVITRPF